MRFNLRLFSAGLFLSISAHAQDVPAVQARLISLPEFELSSDAEAVGIEGKVVVRVEIDKMGAVRKAEVVAGPAWPCGTNPRKELAESREWVRKNALNARFTPAEMGGKPTSSRLDLIIPIGAEYRKNMERAEKAKAEYERARAANPSMKVNTGHPDIINGKAIKMPKPDYPAKASRNGVGGEVYVEVTLDESGRVDRAGAQSGHPYLHSAARDAACKALFTQTSIKGVPQKVTGVITYNFQLSR